MLGTLGTREMSLFKAGGGGAGGALPVSKMDRDNEDSVVAAQATGGTARVLTQVLHHSYP